MPSHRGQFFSAVRGVFALHGQLEQQRFADASRREAASRRAEIENAEPSVALGHGRLANFEDVRRWGYCDSNGLFLGAVDRRFIFYSGEAHLLTYARTGSGKGRDLILANLAHSRDRSLFVLDLKDGENCYASFDHRASRLGHRCIVLDPFNLSGRGNTRINPLHNLIDIAARGENIDTQADEIVLIILPGGKADSGENGWARRGGRRLLSVKAEDLAYYDPANCTLGGLWRFVNASDDQLLASLNAMKGRSREGIARRAGAFLSVFNEAPKQFEAYRSEAIDALAPFEPGKSLELATSAHDFDFGLLKHEPCSVYLVAPSERIGATAQWTALIVNHAIEAIARAVGPVRTTFLLDEFPLLPPAPAIQKSLRLYRGKGINLWMFAQGRYSLETQWSHEAVREFEDQAAVFQTWSVEDQSLLRDITLWSGTKTISSRGINHGGGVVETAGANLGETQRPVLQTEDIRAIGEDGRQIIKFAGRPYLLPADRVPFFTVDPWKWWLRDVRELHYGVQPE